MTILRTMTIGAIIATGTLIVDRCDGWVDYLTLGVMLILVQVAIHFFEPRDTAPGYPPHYSGFTFTFEPVTGIQFHYHRTGDPEARGVRLWYFGADYDNAFPPGILQKDAAQVEAEMRVLEADNG